MAHSLEFPDHHFDRVFCLSVMEHIPHDLWLKSIREFERVLKPGGRLVITLDMETSEANGRLYRKLVESFACPSSVIPTMKSPSAPRSSRSDTPDRGTRR